MDTQSNICCVKAVVISCLLWSHSPILRLIIVIVVKFSNGHVKNAEQLDFQLLKHADGVNPRKKNRRIVVKRPV